MSTTLKTSKRLKDSKCKKGQLSSWPPVPYVPPMNLVTTKEVHETLKIKLPDGTVFNMSIFSQGNTKQYLAHVVAVLHLICQNGLNMQCTGSWPRLFISWTEHSRISWRLLGPILPSCQMMTWRPASWRLSRPNRCSKKPRRLTMRQLLRRMSFWGTSCPVTQRPTGIAFATRCTSGTCRALILGTRSFLAKKQKVPISWRKIPAGWETFLWKKEKTGSRRNECLNQKSFC